MNVELEQDVTVWEAFRSGSDPDFMRLYQRYLPKIYNYAYNIVRDRSLVEDAIQDVFLSLYQHRTGLQAVQSVQFYLMRAVRNRLLLLLKKSPTDQIPFDGADGFRLAETPDPEWIRTEADAEQSRRLRHLINDLPKRQREALYLIYFEQLSYPEAAGVMGITVKTVYNLVLRALTTLRHTPGISEMLFSFGLTGLLFHCLATATLI